MRRIAPRTYAKGSPLDPRTYTLSYCDKILRAEPTATCVLAVTIEMVADGRRKRWPECTNRSPYKISKSK